MAANSASFKFQHKTYPVRSVRIPPPSAPRNQMAKVAPEAPSNGKGDITQQRKKADGQPEVTRRPTDEQSVDEAASLSKASDKATQPGMLTGAQKLAVAQVLFARRLHHPPHNPARARPHPPSISVALVRVCCPCNRHIVKPHCRFLPHVLEHLLRHARPEYARSIPASVAAVHECTPAFGVELPANQRQRHRACVVSAPQPPGRAACHRPAGAKLRT